MDKSTETALYKVQDLVQNERLSIREATEKIEKEKPFAEGSKIINRYSHSIVK